MLALIAYLGLGVLTLEATIQTRAFQDTMATKSRRVGYMNGLVVVAVWPVLWTLVAVKAVR